MGTAGQASAHRPGSLVHRAVPLEWFPVAWMVAEAGVAVTAGSLALTSFGFDTVIELISASLVLRRLQAEQAGAPAGIGLTVSSLIIMPALGWRKRRGGAALASPLVLADAAETILCATLAATTLLGLVLFTAFGWWWADPSPPSPSPGSLSAKAAKPGGEQAG